MESLLIQDFIECTPVPKLLLKILKCHGKQGFVDILKGMKAWAFQIVSGNTNFTLPWSRTSVYLGYRYPRRFKNLFRPLIKAVVRRNYHVIQEYLSYFNIYQVIKGPLKERSDYVKVIFQPAVVPPSPFWSDLLRLVLTLTKYEYRRKEPDDVRPTGQSVAITPVETGSYAQWVAKGAPGSPIDHKVLTASWFRGLTDTPYRSLWQGNLSVIGDWGGKGRLILIGNPVVQSRLKPLQEDLLQLLRWLPTDCTFDQTQGHSFVIENQKAGKPLYSVDLSDATWNFPFSLQKQVLQAFGADHLLELFELPISNQGSMVKVEKGQAMGLNPSFPLFSLTHNLILIGMCKWLGLKPTESFRVLGDDVVLANPLLHKMYLKFCEDYEIPVSYHKCLQGRAAEFAGKIFLDGKDLTPIRWRMLARDQLPQLFYPYRKILGKRVYSLITDKTAFLTLGGLPRISHGLGISGFDQKYPVTLRHLKLRLGILDSLLANKGDKPKLRGNSIRLEQRPLDAGELIIKPGPDLLRELGRYVDCGKDFNTNWGELPYLGNPFQNARQLGVEIPLLPKFRPLIGNPFREQLTWRYFNVKKGESRERTRCTIREGTDALKEWRRIENLQKLNEEKAQEESERVKKIDQFFVGSLFYGDER